MGFEDLACAGMGVFASPASAAWRAAATTAASKASSSLLSTSSSSAPRARTISSDEAPPAWIAATRAGRWRDLRSAIKRETLIAIAAAVASMAVLGLV